MGRLYTPDDMYVANHLGALEALDAGVTTLYDWSHNNNTPDHADEAVRGLKDAGLRAVFGYGNANDEWIPPSTLPTNFSDVERVRRSHFSNYWKSVISITAQAQRQNSAPVDGHGGLRSCPMRSF
jgi:5-methylthioadenosine/S-adenosylhomocysteine deaminase